LTILHHEKISIFEYHIIHFDINLPMRIYCEALQK